MFVTHQDKGLPSLKVYELQWSYSPKNDCQRSSGMAGWSVGSGFKDEGTKKIL